VEPFSTLPQAPRRFWTLFQSAKPWGLDGSRTELPLEAPAWTESPRRPALRWSFQIEPALDLPESSPEAAQNPRTARRTPAPGGR
jgi:hypothetical protein